MQNILIVKLSSLGDVIHTLPAIQALRQKYPQARLTWAVESAHAGIIRGTDLVDELIEWRRNDSSIREFISFIRRLRAQTWDIAIDFQSWQRSGIVTWLSGAKRRYGFMPGGEWSHIYYNERIPAPPREQIHAVERWLKLVEPLGAKFDGLPLQRRYLQESPGNDFSGLVQLQTAPSPAAEAMFPLPIGAKDRAAVDEWLAKNHVLPERDTFVVLNPHCRKEANIWPVDNYVALAEKLVAAGRKVVLTGGPIARDLCDSIWARTDRKVLRSDGQLSLLGSAELIRRASLFVTGDTGPMHIAAAVGTPILALFGPADPLKTGPYAADAVVLTKRLPCAPCYARRCPLGYDPPKCMTDITVDEVFQSAAARLDEGDRRRRLTA